MVSSRFKMFSFAHFTLLFFKCIDYINHPSLLVCLILTESLLQVGQCQYLQQCNTVRVTIFLKKPTVACHTHHFFHHCTLLADSIWNRAKLCPVLSLSLNLFTALLTALSTDGSSQKIRTPGCTSGEKKKYNQILMFLTRRWGLEFSPPSLVKYNVLYSTTFIWQLPVTLQITF